MVRSAARKAAAPDQATPVKLRARTGADCDSQMTDLSQHSDHKVMAACAKLVAPESP